MYPWVKANHLRTLALVNRYPTILSWWEEWEVRIGFRAEVSRVVYYLGSELIRYSASSRRLTVVRGKWTVIFVKRFISASSRSTLYLRPLKSVERLSQLDLGVGYGRVDVVVDLHNQVDNMNVPAGDYPHRRGRLSGGYVNHSPRGGSTRGTLTDGTEYNLPGTRRL